MGSAAPHAGRLLSEGSHGIRTLKIDKSRFRPRAAKN
jgi:hypothetical protein